MNVEVSKVGHASAVEEGHSYWRAILPLAIVAAIALSPAPAGLALYAWYYFAIFAGVIAALVVEPLPSPAIGVIGVTTGTVQSDGDSQARLQRSGGGAQMGAFRLFL